MKKAILALNDLASYNEEYDKSNHSVSAASIGWHIEHSCLVICKVTGTVVQSNPAEYSPSFSFKKILVFVLNQFPRGKAQAPAVVLPTEQTNLASIEQHIQAAKESLDQLAAAKTNQYFTHPIFGKLNKKDTIRFFYIHTNHHLKIIQDILAKS